MGRGEKKSGGDTKLLMELGATLCHQDFFFLLHDNISFLDPYRRRKLAIAHNKPTSVTSDLKVCGINKGVLAVPSTQCSLQRLSLSFLQFVTRFFQFSAFSCVASVCCPFIVGADKDQVLS